MTGHRYRQLFLFLMVLLLPSIAIIVAGRQIADYEMTFAHGQALGRAEAERKNAVDAVGRELQDQLDRIKVQEMANAPAGALPELLGSSHSAVAGIGWVDGQRLVWPWDRVAATQQGGAVEAGRTFSWHLDDAERAEVGTKDFARAAELYRKAMEFAVDGRDRATAQLGLARSLARSGSRTAALGVYRDLMQMPGNLADEYGLAFASYAADPLLSLGASHAYVLESINRHLAVSTGLSPMQTLRWKAALGRLASSQDGAVRSGAGATLERLSAWERDLNELAALQAEFPKLRVTDDSWQSYRRVPGAPLWLIGRTPAGAGGLPLAIAVRGEMLFTSFKPGFEITDAADAGEPLSSRLPGLRVVSAVADATRALEASRSPRSLSLWGVSSTLIVTLTLLLGFLVWRDARRDIHVAELRTQFVSSVSHELKTPLTSIRMFAEILQMRGYADPQLHTEYLETIVNESERLTRLLNNVLDFSRIERGQKRYRMEPTALSEIIQATVRTIQYPLAAQGFVLDLDICDTVPPLAVDRDAIQQAVLNLLTNAMKYSGKRRNIELRLVSDTGGAVIEVTDHGIGIPEKEQARIFEKFYRAQVPENRAISGTGLGLALVAHVMEAHGGNVQVKSKPGEGSRFSLRFPLHAQGAA
jgi:signal transduction histidine kinase